MMKSFTKVNTRSFFIITIRIINEKNKKPTKLKETKIKDNWETNAFVIPFLRHEMPGKELKAILLFNKYKND